MYTRILHLSATRLLKKDQTVFCVKLCVLKTARVTPGKRNTPVISARDTMTPENQETYGADRIVNNIMT